MKQDLVLECTPSYESAGNSVDNKRCTCETIFVSTLNSAIQKAVNGGNLYSYDLSEISRNGNGYQLEFAE